MQLNNFDSIFTMDSGNVCQDDIQVWFFRAHQKV